MEREVSEDFAGGYKDVPHRPNMSTGEPIGSKPVDSTAGDEMARSR